MARMVTQEQWAGPFRMATASVAEASEGVRSENARSRYHTWHRSTRAGKLGATPYLTTAGGDAKSEEESLDSDDLDALMRAGEVYHNLRVPPGCWAVVRVDGRSFTALTKKHYVHPFDELFHLAMVAAATGLLSTLGGALAATHSDEISVLLPRDWISFDRKVEKTISVAAGGASAEFTRHTGHAGAFDGRLWVGATDEQVVDYYRWRQADALRGALNSMAYWTLRHEGKTERQATAALHRKGVDFKNELLFQDGINFSKTPLWQRRGTILHWERHEKIGHNPLTGEDVIAQRRRIRIDSEPPAGDEYSALIQRLLAV